MNALLCVLRTAAVFLCLIAIDLSGAEAQAQQSLGAAEISSEPVVSGSEADGGLAADGDGEATGSGELTDAEGAEGELTASPSKEELSGEEALDFGTTSSLASTSSSSDDDTVAGEGGVLSSVPLDVRSGGAFQYRVPEFRGLEPDLALTFGMYFCQSTTMD